MAQEIVEQFFKGGLIFNPKPTLSTQTALTNPLKTICFLLFGLFLSLQKFVFRVVNSTFSVFPSTNMICYLNASTSILGASNVSLAFCLMLILFFHLHSSSVVKNSSQSFSSFQKSLSDSSNSFVHSLVMFSGWNWALIVCHKLIFFCVKI